MNNPYYRRGWWNESHRHYLAARGVSTALFVSRRRAGFAGKVQGVPIYVKKLQKGRIYPVTTRDVTGVLSKMPHDDLKGLARVEFANPKDVNQEDAWAQYIRSKRKLIVFSQPFDGETIDGKRPEDVRRQVKEYVLPHEVGHHKALYHSKITDPDLGMAEARADANVVGMSVTDSDVDRLRSGAVRPGYRAEKLEVDHVDNQRLVGQRSEVELRNDALVIHHPWGSDEVHPVSVEEHRMLVDWRAHRSPEEWERDMLEYPRFQGIGGR